MVTTSDLEAIILDLDGVITQTARAHAESWKLMFDEYLGQRAERDSQPYVPFDIDADYRQYVDGRPRYEGVRTFLESRGIHLPPGSPTDSPDEETISGLGNRKNERFTKTIQELGVDVFEDTVERVREWREAGLKTAVVSSSRNAEPILHAAGLEELFDTRVDGETARRLDLAGKPEPDTFLEAARRLNVDPAHAAIIEDAEAGVEAGRAGGFGLVVGVDRDHTSESLLAHGADIVVRDLRELDLSTAPIREKA